MSDAIVLVAERMISDRTSLAEESKMDGSNRLRSWCLGLGLFSLIGLSPADANDWLRFRGDNGSGVSVDSDVPLAWSESQNQKWKVELPGPGFSSPIVVGSKVFVTSYSGYGLSREEPGEIKNLKRHLVCLSRERGDILWSVDVPADLPEDPFSGPGVPTHGYASHTPTSDGNHVFAFFGKSGVFAFDMDGEKIWHTKVGGGSDPRAWGSAASVVLHDDLLIVNASAESSAIIALDKASGKEVWRAEAEGLQQTWSTPIVVQGDGGMELVIASPTEVWGLNPGSGKLKWYAAGSEARGMATSLIAEDGMVYCVGGMMGGKSFAVKTGGKDDVSDSNVLWTGRGLSQFGTGVIYQGHLFGVSETGVAYCVNAKNGEVAYQNRLATGEAVAEQAESGGQGGGRMRAPGGAGAGPGNQQGRTGRQGGRRRGGGGGMGGRSYGSAILVNEHVLYTNQEGTTFVFAANPKQFELIHKNSLGAEGDGFNATPAVSNGAIFIRSNKHLYCISKD